MHHTAVVARQRQIRGFVIAWLGITLLLGALTFIGIYYATGLVDEKTSAEDANVAAVPVGEPESSGPETAPSLGSLNTTPVPTAAVPVEEPQAVAAVPEVNSGDAQAAQSAPDGQGGGPVEQILPTITPLPSPTPLPVDHKIFEVGIQVQSNPDASVYGLWMGEVRDKLRLNWIKQQVRWAEIEPQPGQYNWGALDVTFAAAKEYEIKVMVSVVTAPEWAREPGAPLDKVGPPADFQTYANFLTTLLRRYPGQIQAVEVWNEMNIDREWGSIYGLSAQKYVEMLRVAYAAIKAVDPGVIVISGALSPTGYNDGVGAYDDFVYLDMLIQAGLLTTTDCVGIHHNGYNIGPNVPWNSVPNDPTARFRGPFDNPHHSWSFYSTLNGYAQKVQQAGSDKKLCVTEFGWAVTEDLGGTPVAFEFADDNTLQEQAAYFDEAIRLMNEWGFVWLAFVWNLNYGAQAGWDASNDNVPYSLLRPNWVPAPAYQSIGRYDFRGTAR